MTVTPMTLSTARPAPANGFTATLAFGWRGLLKIKHLPEQLMEAVAIPAVFTVMFTYIFGGAMVGSTGDYLEFILPGTLVMAVLLVTMYVGLGLQIDIAQGVHDRIRTLPVWPPAPLVGTLLGEAARHLLGSSIVIGLGLAMGYRPDGGVVGIVVAIGLVVAFAVSLSWAWIVLALIVRTPTAIMSTGTVVAFPLVLASNVFADPTTMPGWLEAFVEVNPVTHLVAVERDLLDGTASFVQVVGVLAISVGLCALFAPLALRLYRR
jgi:ABC-2 type transport system permease protein